MRALWQVQKKSLSQQTENRQYRAMNRLFKQTALVTLRIVISLGICLGLFAIMPLAHRFFKSPVDKAARQAVAPAVIIERLEKKPQPKTVVPRQIRSITPQSSSSQSRSFNQKFSPDLSVGGGTGVAVSQQNLENVIFEEGQTDEPAVPISKSPVVYPQRAREAGITGTVDIVIVIDRQGKVAQVDFEHVPHTMFKRPVLNAVLGWQFKPARVQGVPVSVRVHQSIEFKLEQQ